MDKVHVWIALHQDEKVSLFPLFAYSTSKLWSYAYTNPKFTLNKSCFDELVIVVIMSDNYWEVVYYICDELADNLVDNCYEIWIRTPFLI